MGDGHCAKASAFMKRTDKTAQNLKNIVSRTITEQVEFIKIAPFLVKTFFHTRKIGANLDAFNGHILHSSNHFAIQKISQNRLYKTQHFLKTNTSKASMQKYTIEYSKLLENNWYYLLHSTKYCISFVLSI